MSYQSLIWVAPVYVHASHTCHLTDDEVTAYLVAIAVCAVLYALVLWKIWRLK